MWLYVQRTGALYHNDEPVAVGYSGYAEYRNDPEAQNLKELGPIPCGVYRIGDPVDRHDLGPFCLPLTPDAANQMFGRAGFLIHGDSITHPGFASHGCIILNRATRERMYSSRDRELHVMANRSGFDQNGDLEHHPA